MSTATITTNIANLDKEDRDAADYMIEQENKQRAAMSPPLDPLPNNDNATRKSSYEFILAKGGLSTHLSYVQVAKDNNPSRRTLIDGIKSGKTKDEIIAMRSPI